MAMPKNSTGNEQAYSWKSQFTFKNVTWWVLLVTAVLVVPSIAFTFTTMVHVTGGSEVIIFIVSCWVCVFLGLKLMNEPRINSIMFENITISDPTKQRCSSMIAMVESEISKWKKRYEKCEAIFMNLSKQPAWTYIDEVVTVLSAIKVTVEQNASVNLSDVKELRKWIESAKARVIEGYLHSLEAGYGYAKAEYAQQGKNIDEAFPELGHGNIDSFIKAPLFATTYARELWNALEKEHTLISNLATPKPPFSRAA